jgi:hypothetical protein
VPRADAVVLAETGDPAYHTTEPDGALAGSGWQFQATFGEFLGTPIAPQFFLTAKHIGAPAGQVTFRGVNYPVVAGFDDPGGGDLRIWQIAGAFPEHAPLFTRSDEAGRALVVFGRGRERGAENYLGGVLKGWDWGGAAQNTHVLRWGQNTVTAVSANPFGPGDVLYADFDQGVPGEAHISGGDSGGGVFIQDAGVWKLAGINYATEDVYRRNGPGSFTLLDKVNLFDARGYYSAPSDGALIAGSIPVPNGFYATRISSRLSWIASIIGGNSAPVVAIATPARSVFFTTAQLPVNLTATASDAEDGSLSGTIAWSSSIDGPLGTGPAISAGSLSVGTHTITALAVDSDDQSATASVTVTVTAPMPALPVTAGLVLHLDATQGVAAAGSTVTAWADLSGNGNDVAAINDPQRGAVLTPAGCDSIRLDGVNDALQRVGALTGFPSGNSNRTMFLVTRYNNSTWWAGVSYGTAASNQSFGLNVQRQSVGPNLFLHGYGSGNDLLSTTPGIGAGWLVQSAVLDAGEATHFKDGAPIGHWSHAYNTVLSKLVIGVEIGNAGFAGMDVAAILLYDRALTAGERADVEAYLQTRYLTDTEPPVITVPANLVVEATGSSGAVVNFTASAIDNADGVVATTSMPAPGTLFPLGVTTVTTTAIDSTGNSASTSFTVTVRDTTPPVLNLPPNLNVIAAGGSGAVVSFPVTAVDAVSGPAATTVTPPSGSLFPIGTTGVSVSSTDAAGNTAMGFFTLTVLPGQPGSGPVPVTSGLVLHLDSTQGVATTGSTVTAWADISGNGNAVSAVSNPQRGTAQTPSGLDAVTLDGVNDVLQRTGTLTGFPAGNADRTMFLVAKYNSSTWWAGVAYGNAALNQSFGLNVKHPTGELVLHGYGPLNDLVSTAQGIGAGWMIQSASVAGGTATHFKDGTAIGQFAHTYATGLGKLVIGAEIGNAGFVGMDVAAVLLYDRALSPAEFQNVNDYLRDRYLLDSTPPQITVPAAITVEATGPAGAPVAFSTSAVDRSGSSLATVNLPASGSMFPVGTTTVTAFAVNPAGYIASQTFNVTVRDTTPPTLTVPAPITVEATGPAGAAVTYSASASDIVDGNVAANGSMPSGSTFPLGTTTVTVAATDTAGNTAAANFNVTVADTTPPTITLLGPDPLVFLVGEPFSDPGATALDIVSGSLFPSAVSQPGPVDTGAPGTFMLVYAATDSAGNSTQKQRTVLVVHLLAPAVQVERLLNPAGDTSISFPTILGLDYTLYTSTDLVVWEPLATVPGNGAPATLEHTGAGNDPQRFYKVTVSKSGF